MFTQWKQHVQWVVPLKDKARRAVLFFKRTRIRGGFHEWRNFTSGEIEKREASAIRKYADIHRALVAKHVRRSGVPGSGGSKVLTRKETHANHVERVLKSFGASRLAKNENVLTSKKIGTVSSKPRGGALFDGPSASAARAEDRKIRDEEKKHSRKLDGLEGGSRTREWNSSL